MHRRRLPFRYRGNLLLLVVVLVWLRVEVGEWVRGRRQPYRYDTGDEVIEVEGVSFSGIEHNHVHHKQLPCSYLKKGWRGLL